MYFYIKCFGFSVEILYFRFYLVNSEYYAYLPADHSVVYFVATLKYFYCFSTVLICLKLENLVFFHFLFTKNASPYQRHVANEITLILLSPLMFLFCFYPCPYILNFSISSRKNPVLSIAVHRFRNSF